MDAMQLTLVKMSRDKFRTTVAGTADLAHGGALLQSPMRKAALVHLGHAACKEHKRKAAKKGKLQYALLNNGSGCWSGPQY
jgi:hypothetical protein